MTPRHASVTVRNAGQCQSSIAVDRFIQIVWYGMVWYGIVEFNVPLDTL